MATIEKSAAVERLGRAMQSAGPDDLAEIYNEIFPKTPITEREAAEERSRWLDVLNAHVAKGLAVEEILALWSVVFPEDRPAWYDEESGFVHFDDAEELYTDTDASDEAP